MINLKKVLAVVFSIFILSTGSIAEKGIHGKIIDKLTGEPLSGAHIRLLSSGLSAISDEKGIYQITNLSSVQEKIEVTYLGYQSAREKITLPDSGMSEINFLLSPTVYSREELVITGSRNKESMRDV